LSSEFKLYRTEKEKLQLHVILSYMLILPICFGKYCHRRTRTS